MTDTIPQVFSEYYTLILYTESGIVKVLGYSKIENIEEPDVFFAGGLLMQYLADDTERYCGGVVVGANRVLSALENVTNPQLQQLVLFKLSQLGIKTD